MQRLRARIKTVGWAGSSTIKRRQLRRRRREIWKRPLLAAGSRMMWTTLLLCLGAFLSLSHTQLLDPEEGNVDEGPVELFTTPTTKMGAATSDFGYNLFRQLVARDPKASILLSPVSISAALTQLSMGASTEAEKQLYRTLRFHNLQDGQLHDTLQSLLSALQAPGKGLSLASRVYLERKLRLRLDYLNAVEKQYAVRPKALTGGARDQKEINNWVKQQTGGKVDHLLTSPLPRNAGVVPVGAAYFKGRWVTRFGQSGKMEDFMLDGAAPTRVPMMQQERYPVKMGNDPDLGCTITQVQMDSDVSTIFFLPDYVTQNMTLIEESLTAEFVQDLTMTLHTVQVNLALPVLKLSFSTDVLPLLSDMGLSDWLTHTDLLKITTQAAKLSSLRHKAMMETAPEGSQYASSTPSASGQSLDLPFRIDRPFLFLVRDEPSGALLFIGKVLNPRDLDWV